MTYAWVIDRDNLAELEPESERAAPGTNCNAVGMQGPHDAPENLLRLLALGQGRAFRMRDDDGVLYYEGRILGDDLDGYQGFAPLTDFGTPNAGAVTIEYMRWVDGPCPACAVTGPHEVWTAL